MSEWQTLSTSKSEYSRSEFYCKSRDKGGEHWPLRVHFPEQVINAISVIVAGKEIPDYRTSSDFVRDAVVHRLHDVNEALQSKEIDYAVTSVVMLNKVERLAAEQEAEKRMVEHWKAVFENAERVEVGELLSEAADQAKHMKWKRYRDQLQDEIKYRTR